MRPSFMRFIEVSEREFVYNEIKDRESTNDWFRVKDAEAEAAKTGAECLPYRLRGIMHTWASYPCDGGFYPYAWSAGSWLSGHLYYDRLDSIMEFRGGFR